MTVEELINKVVNHDWYYDFSDDLAVWNQGKESEKSIISGIKELRIAVPDLKEKVRAAILEKGGYDYISTMGMVEVWFARGT